ncbi:MAG: Crp/Fnr family transcriptional regulator [Magnetospirillum sp.]|nr:Crp/Fnr family transcriptional regulator [Magnetospirillum sp.]
MPHRQTILDALSDPRNQAFVKGFSRRRIAERVLMESDDDGVFVVLAGQMRVFLSYEGKEFTLFFLEPGDIFSLHSGALVETRRPTELLFANIATFEQALEAYPSLSRTVIATLGRTLKSTLRIIEDLMFSDVRQRIIHVLLDRAEEHGRTTPGGIVLDMDCNTEDLANLVGATRQSASAVLNELIKAGALSRTGRTQWLVPDLTRLRRHALPHDSL